MKVFLSWSGQQSRSVAWALRDWLPSVLQAIEPWLSSEDIPAGGRWVGEISKALDAATVGILCLTAENLNSGWLNFEAGALSKRSDHSIVGVYAVGIKPSDVTGPLAQFQVTRADKEDTYRLLRAINSALGDAALPEPKLQRSFERWWPDLEKHLHDIAIKDMESRKSQKTQEEKVDDILGIVQQIARNQETIVHDNQKSTRQERHPSMHPDPRDRPRVFIGSSSEGLAVAETIQLGLDRYAECTIWNQSVFGLSSTTFESIVDAAAEFDFAVLILTPDDMLVKRGQEGVMPRDNIIFEIGLFTGALGRARTFMVHRRDAKLELPSDLAGVTTATYADRSDGNFDAALGPVCTRIKRAMGVAEMVTMRKALRDLGGDEEGIQET
jgi:predicted nucleotide-binding protein